jgi:ribose-phosphate pyrophosphokinase
MYCPCCGNPTLRGRRVRDLYVEVFAAVLAASLILCGASSPALSNPLMVGLRGHDSEIKQACAVITGCEVLASDSKEFENGNTFVRVSGDVANQTVIVQIPDVLTPDELMETLIKIRTISINGAAQTIVRIESPSADLKMKTSEGELIDLNFETLFSAAGAELLTRNNESKRLSPIQKIQNFKQGFGPQKIYIMNGTYPELTAQIAKYTKLPIITQFDSNLTGSLVYLVSPSIAPVNENFFKTLHQISEIKSKGGEVALITPYLPYARSDKVDQPGTAAIGRLIADLIENAGAKAVFFVRAHAPQSTGFFSIIARNISGRKTIDKFLQQLHVDMIISPDAGFQKDATLYAQELGIEVGVINKQRDPTTSKTHIFGMSGPSVVGKTVALIDDEIASGGTLSEAAQFLKASGAAKVIAIATHLAGSAEKVLASPNVDLLAVTDTLPVVKNNNPKLVVLPIAKEISNEINTFIPKDTETLNCGDILGRITGTLK